MAAQETEEDEKSCPQGTMAPNALAGIGGTAGTKAALPGGAKEGDFQGRKDSIDSQNAPKNAGTHYSAHIHSAITAGFRLPWQASIGKRNPTAE
jgi:hypothetical protein